MEKENNQPKMTIHERARLQAFKNVMERKKEKSELNKNMNREELTKEFEKRKENLNKNIKEFNNRKTEIYTLESFHQPSSNNARIAYLDYYKNQVDKFSDIVRIENLYKEKATQRFFESKEMLGNRNEYFEEYFKLRVEETSLLIFQKFIKMQ